MVANANVNRNSGIQIGNASIPSEGPKAVPFALDFTAQPVYNIDLSFLFQNKVISVLQCVYADNSLSGTILFVTMTGTQQTIQVPAGAQGYFPILSPTNGVIQVSSGGGVLVKLELLNVPMSTGMWFPHASATGGDLYDNAGALKTIDQGLAPYITADGLKVNGAGGGGSSVLQPVTQLLYCEPFNGTLNFLVPDAGNYIYITRIEFNITSDATLRAGAAYGMFKIAAYPSGPTIYKHRFDLPSAAAPVYPTMRGFLYESANPIKTPLDQTLAISTLSDVSGNPWGTGYSTCSIYGYQAST